MSANSYLTSLAGDLVLKGSEESSINTSISYINNRISTYFGSSVITYFKFGLSTRGTILPRKADENSDIDYMVVFNTSGVTYKPQTYLNQLRQFAERYYSSSEIHQSHPTVVLELNHIKFELVPSIYDYMSRCQIPSPANYWNDWILTAPQ
jgi:tRNA nucleotidyltransferase (CCA-adding enzyme)